MLYGRLVERLSPIFARVDVVHAALTADEMDGDHLVSVKSNEPSLAEAIESLRGGSFSP
jgi:hypothetical protein